MSWFSKNYEKTALGAAGVVALGLAYLGFAKIGSVETDFGAGLKGRGNNNAAVRNADLIPKALSSLKLDRTWEQAVVDERPVDLFTGIPLFVASSAPEVSIDPYRDAPIHPPIPNTWWLTNRLDPGFGDSPNRDPDQDGFFNIEEFKGKTDPNDAKSHPPLIAKLMYLKDESLGWVLRPSFGDAGAFPFKYLDTKGGANTTGANPVPVGQLFFPKGAMLNRFKLLGSEVREELNKATNVPKDVTWVRVEDQRPNKKGMTYEFPSPLQEERMNEYMKFDRTAVFSLEALGQNGKEFKVEENLTFSLPSGGAKKDYRAKVVTPESVTIEYTDADGTVKTVQISKGSMPQLPE